MGEHLPAPLRPGAPLEEKLSAYGQPFNANIAPLAMLVVGLFFLLYGAHRYSLDAVLARRRRPPALTGG